MTSCGGQGERRDRAVIMARGAGSRMGSPKGLLRLRETGPTFLRILLELYLARGIPVDVVTTPEMGAAYAGELPPGGNARILTAEPGGDTARTLLAAWLAWRAEGTACTHLWAHPVDVPLVEAATLEMMERLSRRQPDRALRPAWKGDPGHPVLLPAVLVERLRDLPRFQEGPFRNFLEARESGGSPVGPVMIEVPDPNVVRDFDRPVDLEPDDGPAAKRGPHE